MTDWAFTQKTPDVIQKDVPAPGGGVFVGPGGRAPETTPIGPTAVGWAGPISTTEAGIIGLPGHGTTPGQFQPGGGQPYTSMQNVTLAAQQAASQGGYLAQIIPVPGTVGAPPSVGGGPIPPSPGQPPTVGGGPITPPPTVGGGPIIPPEMGGGPTTGAKPKGLKTLPVPPDKPAPSGPPKPPGQWVTVDGGKGQPPAYGFIPSESHVDTGLEPAPKKGAPVGPKPPIDPNAEKGHYVSVAIPYAQPAASGDYDPVWCWIPEIATDYGVKDMPPTVAPASKP